MNKRQRKKQKKSLEEENERLRRENAELERQRDQLERRKDQLEKELGRLEARIAKLEGRVRQNSQNSSMPPSSDPPFAPARPPKPRSGRNPGGQPGHKGHQRELVPPERVNKTIPVKPEQCRGCKAKLSGEDPAPRRHQVTEIPKIIPHVTEYQLHALTCSKCYVVTAAVLPKGVASGAFGPHAVAIVSLLTSFYHLGRREAAAAMLDLFGVKMALGSVTACERITSAALEAPVAEAQAYVKEQKVKHGDETSWYEGVSRKKVWIWVLFTTQVTVFLVRASRGTVIAKELLGEAFGVLVTDRWCAYTWWPLRWRQLCWAHLKRHFQAFSEERGEAKRIGLALLDEEKLLFSWWHRVRDGTLARSSFQNYVVALRRRVEALLRKGSRCGHPKTEGMCREILKLAPAMWTFVRLEGVEPTNNCAERAIRRFVLWRKICFGTHSAAGSRFAERMMTVACTLRQQGRNVVDYVTNSVAAAQRGENPQSLLPATAQTA